LVWRLSRIGLRGSQNQITATLAQSSQAEPIVFDGPKNARSFVNWQEKFHYPKWVLLDD
jgi:hypothetical protein